MSEKKPNMDHNPPDRQLIDRTYRVRVPCGNIYEVNVFDYNLQSACAQIDEKAREEYIELADGSWAKFKTLELIREAEKQEEKVGGGE